MAVVRVGLLSPADGSDFVAGVVASRALHRPWLDPPDDLDRIEGRCDGRNAASAAVLRRLGMRQEAHLVGHQRFKGEWDDELVFAVLEDAWRLRSGASTLGLHLGGAGRS